MAALERDIARVESAADRRKWADLLLAHLHEGALDYPLHQPNLRGLAWWEATVPVVEPHVEAPIVALLESELAFQRAFQARPGTRGLPAGAVHADLFELLSHTLIARNDFVESV